MQDLTTLLSDLKSLESADPLLKCCQLQLAIRKGHLLFAINSAVPYGLFDTILKRVGVLPFSLGSSNLGTAL